MLNSAQIHFKPNSSHNNKVRSDHRYATWHWQLLPRIEELAVAAVFRTFIPSSTFSRERSFEDDYTRSPYKFFHKAPHLLTESEGETTSTRPEEEGGLLPPSPSPCHHGQDRTILIDWIELSWLSICAWTLNDRAHTAATAMKKKGNDHRVRGVVLLSRKV